MLKRYVLYLGLLTLLPACASGITSPKEPYNRAENSFEWLSGCWSPPSTGYREIWAAREVWSVEAATLLFGYSVVLERGDVLLFDQLRLERLAGEWYLSTYPQGVGPIKFILAESSDTDATFINPDNDYPQRIRYTRNADALIVETSAMDGANTQGWTYHVCSV